MIKLEKVITLCEVHEDTIPVLSSEILDEVIVADWYVNN